MCSGITLPALLAPPPLPRPLRPLPGPTLIQAAEIAAGTTVAQSQLAANTPVANDNAAVNAAAITAQTTEQQTGAQVAVNNQSTQAQLTLGLANAGQSTNRFSNCWADNQMLVKPRKDCLQSRAWDRLRLQPTMVELRRRELRRRELRRRKLRFLRTDSATYSSGSSASVHYIGDHARGRSINSAFR